jgi:hypothetical protein
MRQCGGFWGKGSSGATLCGCWAAISRECWPAGKLTRRWRRRDGQRCTRGRDGHRGKKEAMLCSGQRAEFMESWGTSWFSAGISVNHTINRTLLGESQTLNLDVWTAQILRIWQSRAFYISRDSQKPWKIEAMKPILVAAATLTGCGLSAFFFCESNSELMSGQ